MKRLVIVAAILAGCTMPPAGTKPPDVISTTAKSCETLVAAITAADQAILMGTLKGQDARNAVTGLAAAQAGCKAALAAVQSASAPASGVAK